MPAPEPTPFRQDPPALGAFTVGLMEMSLARTDPAATSTAALVKSWSRDGYAQRRAATLLSALMDRAGTPILFPPSGLML